MPWRRGRAESVAQGTIKGCRWEVHQASGHGRGRGGSQQVGWEGRDDQGAEGGGWPGPFKGPRVPARSVDSAAWYPCRPPGGRGPAGRRRPSQGPRAYPTLLGIRLFRKGDTARSFLPPWTVSPLPQGCACGPGLGCSGRLAGAWGSQQDLGHGGHPAGFGFGVEAAPFWSCLLWNAEGRPASPPHTSGALLAGSPSSLAGGPNNTRSLRLGKRSSAWLTGFSTSLG